MPARQLLEFQWYDTLFNAFPEAVAVVDRELIIQYSNKSYARLFALEGDSAGLAIGYFLPLVHIKNLVNRAGMEKKF